MVYDKIWFLSESDYIFKFEQLWDWAFNDDWELSLIQCWVSYDLSWKHNQCRSFNWDCWYGWLFRIIRVDAWWLNHYFFNLHRLSTFIDNSYTSIKSCQLNNHFHKSNPLNSKPNNPTINPNIYSSLLIWIRVFDTQLHMFHLWHPLNLHTFKSNFVCYQN